MSLLDSYGNYAPTFTLPADQAAASSRVILVSGSPQGVTTGSINQLAFDTVGATFYQNTDGTVNGWVAAGGSSASVTYGHGAPVSTPTGAAIYTDRDTGTIYTWTGSAWA